MGRSFEHAPAGLLQALKFVHQKQTVISKLTGGQHRLNNSIGRTNFTAPTNTINNQQVYSKLA